MSETCNCPQCQRNRREITTKRVCSVCKNENCPKAWFHALRCTNSNEPGQIGVEE